MFAIPLLACAYALLVIPLLIFLDPSTNSGPGVMETRYENRVFWPMLAALSVVFVFLHPPPRGSVYFPPHVIALLLYLVLAGASILWAFSPDASFIRFLQQLMIVMAIFLPVILATRPLDLTRGLFVWFAIACILNVFFVLVSPEPIVDGVPEGHHGFFAGKNTLGQCAAVALLLSLHEMLYPGRRRIAGIIVAIMSLSLVYLSNSKTSLGLALLAPLLAALALVLQRTLRMSPAILPVAIVGSYFVLSGITDIGVNRLSYYLYGDSSFTGRVTIWDFVFYKIQQRPLFGWGYQSFWLVGPSGPSVVDGPGWVKLMPNGHNGYYDTILETGYVGLTLLLSFIILTLHSIGRVADRAPGRAWLLLSLAFFIITYNGLESSWVRGYELLWVVFLIVAADAARYRQPRLSGDRAPRVRRHSPVLRGQGRERASS